MRNEMLEFVLFTYFAINPEEKENIQIIANKCAHRAYLDMNRTLRYRKDSTEDDRKTFCDKMCEMISKKIVDELAECTVEEFDEWHMNFCEDLIKDVQNYKYKRDIALLRKIELGNCKKYIENAKEDSFYYGQAQKWINMTMKYMWMLGLMENEFKRIKPVLHVPVDSYIIEAIWHEGREENTNGQLKEEERDWCVKLPMLAKSRKNKYSNDKVVPWSRWTKDDYIEFQKNLRAFTRNEQVNWECKNWINVAKVRR